MYIVNQEDVLKTRISKKPYFNLLNVSVDESSRLTKDF